jgi:hypothetical protein
MAKVEFLKARKDYPEHKINKGDMYYTWQLYRGPTRRSLTRPTRSQLTSSEFLVQVYDFADDALPNAQDPGDFESIASELENLGQEQEGKLDNMPEGFRNGQTGEQLEARKTSCEEWAQAINDAASEFETAVTDIEADDDLSDDEKKEKIDEARAACVEACLNAEPDWE